MDNIFAVTDEAIEKAGGSTDPNEVADYNHVLVADPLTGNITGMAMRFSTLGVIAVNENLDVIWRPYTLWHELAHILRKHVDEPSFNFHQDKGIFCCSIYSKSISRQEMEANLISAEYNIDTELILDLIGYHNQTMQDYLRLKQYQNHLTQAYDSLRFSSYGDHPSGTIKYRMAEYRRSLMDLEEKRQDLESDIASMNCFKSILEIANEIGTNEVILKYKLEAMRIRGYDIAVQELERYNKVFLKAL